MKVPWSENEWRSALVYGLGLSGRAAARLLRSRGVDVVGVDRRSADQLDLAELASDSGVELMLGSDPEVLPATVDGVVVSPGVAMDRPLLRAARRAGLPVVAEVELGFLFVRGPVIGVTGSNGKSTTTALTGAVLRACGAAVEVCGNIGLPLSACVEGPAERVFVIELSSFQLEGVDTFRPRAAALLNLSADHLDRHLDLERYAAAKRALFARQREEDVAVLNADDPLVAATAVRARRRWFSRLREVGDGCFLDGDRVMTARPGRAARELFRAGDLSLPGTHNLENAMAAALLAQAVIGDDAEVAVALRDFAGLPHRLQRIAESDGVAWFDDSKATNVAAAVKSLEGFRDESVHLILGGRHKGGSLESLRPVVAKKAVRVYLIGEAAEELATVLEDTAPCERAGRLQEAVASAARRAATGQSVLLSPACASFDQYCDFGERGRHFQDLVRALDG